MGTQPEPSVLPHFPNENPHPMLRVGCDGTVRHANAAGNALLSACKDTTQGMIPQTWRDVLTSLDTHAAYREIEFHCDDRVFSCVFVAGHDGDYVDVFGVEITSRKRAETALTDREEQMRSLIASIDDQVFAIDLAGRIQVFHQAPDSSHDTLVTPSQRLIGKHYRDVLPAELAQPLEQTISQARATLRTEQFEYSIVTNHVERFYNARVSPLIAQDVTLTGFTVVTSDITAAKLARQRQQRLLELEHLHRMISTIFLDVHDLDDALGQVLAKAGQSLDVSRAYAFLRDDHDGTFKSTHEWCAAGVPTQHSTLRDRSLEELMPSWFTLLATQGFIAPYAEVSELPDDIRAVFEPSGVQTLVAIPSYTEGQLSGVIGFAETRAPRQWLPEEIAVLRSIVESYTRMLERYQSRRELMRARDMAVQSAQFKSEFITNINHEIRTPLTLVLGTLDLLRETSLDEYQKNLLSASLKGARQLHGIVNNVLDFSRLEAGYLTLDSVPFNVRALVRDLASAMQPHAEQKQIALTGEVGSDVPKTLVGDPVRLRQVLTSLVSNGIKFTPSGSVRIVVELVTAGVQYATLRFAVIDTGIGIADEDQKYIFDSFVQADGSPTRRYGGTGLGLALSQQLVKLMGGTIAVESRQGHGSVFEFTVTLKIGSS